MRISDWSSDVCSSDLRLQAVPEPRRNWSRTHIPEARQRACNRARLVAAVELQLQQPVPRIAARAGRSRHAEDEGIARLPGKGPGLHRGDPDAGEAFLEIGRAHV